jgi:hypothetical protein
MRIRPLSLAVDTQPSCSWATCPGVVVAERLSVTLGWLPVCEHHGHLTANHGPWARSMGRVICAECGTDRPVLPTGKIRAHPQRGERCPGSGTVAEGQNVEGEMITS